MRATRVVFDASVLVRAGVDENPAAREWVRAIGTSVDAVAPDLLWPEVGNALRRLVLARRLRRSDARDALQNLLRLPLSLHRTESLITVAVDAAIELKLTVYDALYAVLADVLDATLVTADRRLAEVAGKAALIR